MKKILLIIILAIFLFPVKVHAATNPYGKYQNLYGITTVRCTWYAWQEAYEHTGVVLPGWGNAQTWYNSAARAGYQVGREAKPNSIVVFSSQDGYGHVGFVVSVDGDTMITNEGGIVTEENDGIVEGMVRSTSSDSLIGYIYLDEAPNKTNTSNSNKTNQTTNKKSSNNNLKNLTLDIDHFSFDKEKTDYKIEVDYDTAIIEIKAEAEDKKAIISGTGKKALEVGENKYKIIVTAQNGEEKEYSLSILRKEKNTSITFTPLEEKVKPKKEMNSKLYVIAISAGILFLTSIIILMIRIRKRETHEKNVK